MARDVLWRARGDPLVGVLVDQGLAEDQGRGHKARLSPPPSHSPATFLTGR